MNLLTIFTNVGITDISFNGKYNELTISHGQKHSRPLTLPHWTNQNVFPLFSLTTQPFVPSHLLFANTFTSLFHPPRCYNVFKAAPIVAYRRSSNLSDFLVRAQLRNLVQHNQPRGSYPCGKNCLTCKYISDGQTSYIFHATGETRPITNHIDCNSKNVIYMIQCNQCSKQYIGETKRRLKDRFNEHRRPVDNPSNISKPTTVSEHFLTNDHSANDITLIPLELTKSNRDSVRKAREAYLIERGKTLEPLGINKKDEM